MVAVKTNYLVLLCFFLLSCTSEISPKDSRRFTEIKVYETSGKVPIPESLWNEFDKFYINTIVGDKKTIEKRKENIPRSPMNFEVLFIEDKGALLGGKNILLQYSKGGGHLNLADYIKNKVVGSFRFSLNFPNPEEINRQNFKVYHITNAKPDKKLGKLSKCGSYSDVTDFFLRQVMKKGLLLTNRGQRHITVLAGTFVFILVKDSEFFISQLTISDSNHRKMLCIE